MQQRRWHAARSLLTSAGRERHSVRESARDPAGREEDEPENGNKTRRADRVDDILKTPSATYREVSDVLAY
jgi:hypothetical protein